MKNKVSEEWIMDLGKEIVNVYRSLIFNSKEFVISKRILKSGTEACTCCLSGFSKKAYRRAVETEFWLKMLKNFLSADGEEKYLEISEINKKVEMLVSLLEKELEVYDEE